MLDVIGEWKLKQLLQSTLPHLEYMCLKDLSLEANARLCFYLKSKTTSNKTYKEHKEGEEKTKDCVVLASRIKSGKDRLGSRRKTDLLKHVLAKYNQALRSRCVARMYDTCS